MTDMLDALGIVKKVVRGVFHEGADADGQGRVCQGHACTDHLSADHTSAEPEGQDSARQGPMLVNSEVELGTKANCFLSRLAPKPGTIMLGDGGIDFIAASGRGFVAIPWPSIQKVRADVYGKHVRGIEVVTADGRAIPFVLSRGHEVLRVIHAHLGRTRIVSMRHNVALR